MKISDIMWSKIKYIEQEIKNLKTARFKTASTISTIEKTGSISLPLKLFGNPSTYYEVISSKRAIVTLTTTDSTNMISALYLNGITPSNLNDRYIFVHKLNSDVGKSRFAIYVYSQNENDFNVLAGGGIINVNYNIQGVGSSNFTMSINYEDFDPWS